MSKLGVKEAAEAIRGAAERDHMQRVDPAQAHQLKFVAAVCAELNLDASAENVHHVMGLLREHGIELHEGHEYPKWVVRKYDNTRHIVNDEQEEDEIVNAEAPKPPGEAARDGADTAADGAASQVDDLHEEQLDTDGDDTAEEVAEDPKPVPDPRKPGKRPM